MSSKLRSLALRLSGAKAHDGPKREEMVRDHACEAQKWGDSRAAVRDYVEKPPFEPRPVPTVAMQQAMYAGRPTPEEEIP